MSSKYIVLKSNPGVCNINDIPVLQYKEFFDLIVDLLSDSSKHCLTYFAYPVSEGFHFICAVADDRSKNILVSSHTQPEKNITLKSLTSVLPQLHAFEREIYENYGIKFNSHPWLKPIRYPFNRFEQSSKMEDYPFYNIESDELHEVGVGPVHAGVIEPGHFRFICNGEKVLHLEIQLGYQHRGIEYLMSKKESALQRCIIAENIAGDTAVGHGLAHAQLIEALSAIETNEKLAIERCIALEMERIAMHIGDTAALSGDVAYQLGQVVCEALRTTVINTTQEWCGNRFGKSLIRPGGTNFPFSNHISELTLALLENTGKRFNAITERIFTLPSLLSRFEDIGIVTGEQALKLGLTGVAARSSGLPRDVRASHPFQYYTYLPINPITQKTGDVLARARQRHNEVEQSTFLIRNLIERWEEINMSVPRPSYHYQLKPSSFAISLTEGWRGEICHVCITDEKSRIKHYKVKDPSFHNWMALAIAVRNQEISDFPLCNKSFNLSYCGHDL